MTVIFYRFLKNVLERAHFGYAKVSLFVSLIFLE